MGFWGRNKTNKYSDSDQERMALQLAKELPSISENWYKECVKALQSENPDRKVEKVLPSWCARSIKAYCLVNIAHYVSSRKYFGTDLGRAFNITILTKVFEGETIEGSEVFGEYYSLISDSPARQRLVSDHVTKSITNNVYSQPDTIAVEWKINYLLVILQIAVFSAFQDHNELSSLPGNIPTMHPEYDKILKMAKEEIHTRQLQL